MGGYGSGAYGLLGSRIPKVTVEQCKSVDIRRWQRDKRLDRSFVWGWYSDDGEQTASIGVYPHDDHIVLSYSANNKPIKTTIILDETPNGYGKRKWFLCPSCYRRCAVLYLRNKYFKCRTCQNLNYRSSQVQGDKMAEIDRKLIKIVQRLGGTMFKPDGLIPSKPKHMHHTTYERYRREYRRLIIEREMAFVSQAMRIMRRIRRL